MKFICKEHPEEVQEHFEIRIIGGKNCDSRGKPIVCSVCQATMTHDVEKGDFHQVSIGKFSTMSREGKKAHLKARSKTHSKKNREYRRYLDTKHLKGEGGVI